MGYEARLSKFDEFFGNITFFWGKVYFLSEFLLAIFLLGDNFYSALQDSIFSIHKSNALNIPSFLINMHFWRRAFFDSNKIERAFSRAFFEGFKVSEVAICYQFIENIKNL